ncbi:Aste57867_15126 [Aphanomyces stellatus]|uniref:Aste57867_15126 protein n=1 Tax=Aphanomyces stellatus TaxID=120398 RepID=A0A485L393_9STRA|nr:hypothetical protein As57867_015070 [Aphanomyces stellatus]VFT91936.1 Aste57867_15126 [Aphanomyces stellatus]
MSFVPRLNAMKTIGARDTTSSTSGGVSRPRFQRPGTALDKSKPTVIDVTCPTTEVEWEGYLYKQSKIVKTWTPRYVTLKDGVISYYKSKKHAVERTHDRGSWTVAGVHNTIPSTGFGGTKLHASTLGFSVVTTNNNLIHLVAISPCEKEMWIYMLEKCYTTVQQQAIVVQGGATDLEGSARLSESLFHLDASEASPMLFGKLINVLGDSTVPELMDELPFFTQHLSQDVELKFNFEPADAAKYAFCHGVYYAREGFVHFVSLFRQCFALVEQAEAPTVTAKDSDIIEVVAPRSLSRLSTKDIIAGRLHVRFNFSPSGRISRLSVYFRQDRTLAPAPTSRGRGRTLYKLESHPQNFHLCYKTKRSLLLSFRDFEILGVLGQGGFGTVVLVQRKSHDEMFAIKVVDKSSGSASALKERRILSTLRHPFLARLRFAFQTQSKLFLGLDFYTGGNLYYHMHATTMSDGTSVETSGGKRLGIDRARFYAAELALAFAYLHAHGIIYRDLKPDNIMLDQEGHIRLVDFGISKQLMQAETTGTLAGSPAYIAPEQLSTQNPLYGYAADWWSWGVMLYEMLYGNTPFHDNNVSVMYRKITDADIKYSNHFDLDPVAIDLLQKVLVREPSERLNFPQIKAHPFFESIDWVLLLQKQVPPPFIPTTRDVFDHVSQHFKKMNVNSLDDTPCVGNSIAPSKSTGSMDQNFDDFSFCYERPDVRDEMYEMMIQVKETFANDVMPSAPPTLEHQSSEDITDHEEDNDMDPEVDLVIRDTELEEH